MRLAFLAREESYYKPETYLLLVFLLATTFFLVAWRATLFAVDKAFFLIFFLKATGSF